MSGGSHHYLCFEVDDWRLDDALTSLLHDIFRMVEWAESHDTTRKDAEPEVYDRVLRFMNDEVA